MPRRRLSSFVVVTVLAVACAWAPIADASRHKAPAKVSRASKLVPARLAGGAKKVAAPKQRAGKLSLGGTRGQKRVAALQRLASKKPQQTVRHKLRARAAHYKKWPKSTPRNIAAAGLRGTFIDGPLHTWSAIKKNPIKFTLGVAAIGGIGVLGTVVGFPGGLVALGLAGLAVGAQVKMAWPKIKKARGAELAHRIGADIVWPVLLSGASTYVGHFLIGHGHASHGSPTTGDIVSSFFSSAAIGGDAPAVGVTAWDTYQGGDAPH